MEEIKCIGCGAVLQSENEKLAGYVPQKVLQKDDLTHITCQRCHQIKNYNLICKNEMPISKYYEILTKLTKKNALFVYVLDVFNIDSTLSKEVIDLIKEKDVLLVCNKIDILPKSLKENKIALWIRHYAKMLGLKVKDVIVTSTLKKINIDLCIAKIDELRYGRDVYVLGATNVGKSSLINAMLRAEGMLDYDLITTSIIPATTLNLIEIPFFLDGILYDTPGLVDKKNILSNVDSKDFSLIMPKKEIKPSVYQLESSQSLSIGGFVLFNFLEGEKNNFITYFSNSLEIKRYKLERSKELFPLRMKELFKFNTDFIEYDRYKFKVEKPTDIVVMGMGFITIKNAYATVEIIVPKGVGVILRDPLIG